MYDVSSPSDHALRRAAVGGTAHPDVHGPAAPCPRGGTATTKDRHQRADGALRLAVEAGNRIGDAFQRTPCRVLFPRSDFTGSLEAVLLNTAGGLTGGDGIRQSVQVGGAAAATVTTQAAEKIYRAADGTTEITTGLAVANGGSLEWLPQETIAFDGAALSRRTRLDLTGDALALALEWLVLGRKAYGETMLSGRIAEGWHVFRNGRLVWADQLRVDGGTREVLACPSLLNRSAALATVLCAAPQVDILRDRARDCLAAFDGTGVVGGATVIAGLMVCRVLGRDGDALRPAMRRLVAELRATFWGRPVGLPRVWNC